MCIYMPREYFENLQLNLKWGILIPDAWFQLYSSGYHENTIIRIIIRILEGNGLKTICDWHDWTALQNLIFKKILDWNGGGG